MRVDRQHYVAGTDSCTKDELHVFEIVNRVGIVSLSLNLQYISRLIVFTSRRRISISTIEVHICVFPCRSIRVIAACKRHCISCGIALLRKATINIRIVTGRCRMVDNNLVSCRIPCPR